MLGIRRYYHEDGFIAGDMVYDANAPINGEERIVDPMDQLRQKVLSGKRFEELLHPLARNGKSVLEPCYRDALAAAERVRQGLENVHETQKRMLNPHSYPVGLECGLAHRRLDLVASRRDIK